MLSSRSFLILRSASLAPLVTASYTFNQPSRSGTTCWSNARLPRHYCAMSTNGPAQKVPMNTISSNVRIAGQSGRKYLICQTIQERGPHHVCLATDGNKKFIMKDVPSSQLGYLRDIYSTLSGNQYLRLPEDEIPGQSMFVYKYFADHFLFFAQKDLPSLAIKRILRDTLCGIAALHEQDIVHTDIKANNILIDWEDSGSGIAIKKVQLADIEDATRVNSDMNIVGLQVGNLMWRSPEAHVQARVSKPSDIFSFGIVCIYAVTKQVIFAVEEEDLGEGEVPLAVILERQISYFADEEGLSGLLKHLGNSPWSQVLEVLRDGFNSTNPRKPVSLWTGIDDDFKDLLVGLTKFDPAQRITAKEALQHKWFKDVL